MSRTEQPALDLLADPDPVGALLAEHARAPQQRRMLALHTSGTTSAPRVVHRSTASWVESFGAFGDLSGTSAASRVWVPGPVRATMNLFALAQARWAGASVVNDVGDATHAHLTPAGLAALLAGQVPAGLTVVAAGDRLTPALAEQAATRGVQVHHYYGAAELSFVGWGRHAEDLHPFPQVQVRRVEGLLRVRSPWLAASTPRDADGFAGVGDRGLVRADGALVVHGRDGGVTSGGATVVVAEVEAALGPAAPGGLVVLGVPHVDLGEVLVAVLGPGDPVDPVRRLARETLAPGGRPRRWYRLPTWPLTTHGKVDRSAVRAAVLDGTASPAH